ncbi:DUF2627 domain-containing protein [Aliicoccus persicus]|uniref:DUF2627 domain-containing protein n=1 Tax=Aliicoccus persicus TaxID=930138 RepID=A0A662Z102_9STAP|nr:DUF2627 domain-containing protein [Aliicoccus persicus]SEV84198.1 Protein of unknown function [Aliicoccus persicus]
MKKFIALMLLVIPVIIAGIGIKLIRDSMFGIINDPFTVVYMQFIIGVILMMLGIWFVAGYIMNRENKHKRLKESLRKKNN